jgi:hypothetical protein
MEVAMQTQRVTAWLFVVLGAFLIFSYLMCLAGDLIKKELTSGIPEISTTPTAVKTRTTTVADHHYAYTVSFPVRQLSG